MQNQKVIRTTFYTHVDKPGYKLKKHLRYCTSLPIQDQFGYNADACSMDFRIKHLLPRNLLDKVHDLNYIGSVDLENEWFSRLKDYKKYRCFEDPNVHRTVTGILLISIDQLSDFIEKGTQIPSSPSSYIIGPLPVVQIYRMEIGWNTPKSEYGPFYIRKPKETMGYSSNFGMRTMKAALSKAKKYSSGNIMDGDIFCGRVREERHSRYRNYVEYMGTTHVVIRCDKNLNSLHFCDICNKDHTGKTTIDSLSCCDECIERENRKTALRIKKIKYWIGQNTVPDKRYYKNVTTPKDQKYSRENKFRNAEESRENRENRGNKGGASRMRTYADDDGTSGQSRGHGKNETNTKSSKYYNCNINYYVN